MGAPPGSIRPPDPPLFWEWMRCTTAADATSTAITLLHVHRVGSPQPPLERMAQPGTRTAPPHLRVVTGGGEIKEAGGRAGGRVHCLDHPGGGRPVDLHPHAPAAAGGSAHPPLRGAGGGGAPRRPGKRSGLALSRPRPSHVVLWFAVGTDRLGGRAWVEAAAARPGRATRRAAAGLWRGHWQGGGGGEGGEGWSAGGGEGARPTRVPRADCVSPPRIPSGELSRTFTWS